MFPAVIPLAGRQLVCDLGTFDRALPFHLSGRRLRRTERLAWLRQELRFLRHHVPGCDASLEHYVRVMPAWTDDWVNDALGFLRWYRRRQSWTPRQDDYWLCQRAICLIGQALQLRPGKSELFAFQRSTDDCRGRMRCHDSPGLAASVGWWIAVNPVRQWVSLSTLALLQGRARPPANVMLFPADDGVRGAVFGLEGLALVNCLIDNAPCTLQEWIAEASPASQESLWGFCRDLACFGVIALTQRTIAA